MADDSDSRLLILYGSQTGAAKSIAESIHTDCVEKGYDVAVASLNDWKAAGFDSTKRLIVVCSTTGNGDPPNNAEE